MSRPLLIGVTLGAGLLTLTLEADARPKDPTNCGGGCTCARLEKVARENPDAYQRCMDKITGGQLGTGPKYQLVCTGGGVYCCPSAGGNCSYIGTGPPPAGGLQLPIPAGGQPPAQVPQSGGVTPPRTPILPPTQR